MYQRKSKVYIFIILIWVIAASAFAGGWSVGSRGYQVEIQDRRPAVVRVNTAPTAPQKINVDLAPLWRTWDLLNERYVDQPLDQQKLLYGALKGLAAAVGDPYTAYLPPQENQEVKDSLNGRYEGIGAELGLRDETLTVISPLEGSPAEAAGVKPQDQILKIDGEETSAMSLAEAVAKIRGPAETAVVLTLKRDERTFDVNIKRQEITIKNISWQDKGDGVVYIRVARFGEATNNDWDRAVGEIWHQVPAVGTIILDVRANPGGYLQASVHLASEFVNSGAIVSQEFGDGRRQSLKPDHRGQFLQLPVVVLIDEGSASAAEILAAALRDLKGAKLVGQKSFGKGTVQDAVDFEDTSSLHVTIARWLTPNGENIDGVGLEVDFEVELDEEKYQNEDSDTQLLKAIEIARGL